MNTEIIKQLFKTISKTLDRKYCEKFIKDYEEMAEYDDNDNDNFDHLTLKFWYNNYRNFAYQMLDQIIYSPRFLQFLKEKGIDPQEVDHYITKNRQLSNEIDIFIKDIFIKFHQEKPLFIVDEMEQFYAMNALDPKEFYLKKDNIGDIQYSKYNPMDFSQYRTSPIIVINDEVITAQSADDHHYQLIDQYEKKHNIKFIEMGLDAFNSANGIVPNENKNNKPVIKDSAVGSAFGKVVLLESIQGNRDNINRTLKNHGYAKVYLAPELSYGSPQDLYPYERIATIKNSYHKVNKHQRLCKLA